MPHLAFYTFGLLQQPFEGERSQEFLAAAPAIYDAAAAAPGYITRRLAPAGGVPRVPASGEAHPVAHTLSLWTDLESVYAFSYRGCHTTALRRRKEWFLPPGWPSYAIWWVSDHALSSWQEAFSRFEHLHDHGPTPYSFDFKHSFDADGQAITIDRERVAALAPLLR